MKKRITIISASALIILATAFLILFIQQYRMLGNTIENERISYVTEIKKELVDNITVEKNMQMSVVDIYCQSLLKTQPEHFSDVKQLFDSSHIEDGDQIYLLDSKGTVYNLDGEPKRLSDNSMAQMLLLERTPVFSYAQINSTDEYWFYGEPLEEITLDGISIKAVLNGRSILNFGSHMATSILNNASNTYVTSKEGNILVFPPQENNMGYNLFSSLTEFGAKKEEVDQIRKDFELGLDGQQFLSYGGNRWLVSYSSDIYDDWVVVVLMPMTITAADTYRMLNKTMLSVSLLVVSIFALLFLLYLRERTRERIAQQEKLRLELIERTAESKNQFLAKMSHDIRTPLNAIMGLLKITENLVEGQTHVQNNLEKLRQSAEYLLSILNDILDMSKIESGKMQVNSAPFNIQDMLDTIESMNMTQASQKGLNFRLEISGNLSACYLGDKLRINQILMNLLSNSIKFTPAGGTVTLYLTAVPADGNADRLQFVVEDTGIGMSEEYLNHLFQPFEQENASVALNYAGSGLGLSIVKNLVDLMGGDIHVSSVKGRGSRFEVSIILQRAETEVEAAGIEAEPINKVFHMALSGLKLLLVEDNDLNAMIATELITNQCGMLVDTASNGQIAVERFKASKAEEYAAILMDIRMPVMNGLEAARMIRGLSHPRAKQIPIIAMSANAFQEDIDLSLANGMNDHLSKPIDIDKLEKTLNLWIGKERENDTE